MDCFTYADYVEALKRANDREEFIDSLIEVRYKDGLVGFQNRKHFFTDWSALAPAIATDITTSLSANAVQLTKNLNKNGFWRGVLARFTGCSANHLIHSKSADR